VEFNDHLLQQLLHAHSKNKACHYYLHYLAEVHIVWFLQQEGSLLIATSLCRQCSDTKQCERSSAKNYVYAKDEKDLEHILLLDGHQESTIKINRILLYSRISQDCLVAFCE